VDAAAARFLTTGFAIPFFFVAGALFFLGFCRAAAAAAAAIAASYGSFVVLGDTDRLIDLDGERGDLDLEALDAIGDLEACGEAP
jgi:hypothetical protein